MNIDFYCFIMDEFQQSDYYKRKKLSKAKIYENFEFDINVAKSLGKCAIYCKEMDKFYNENWEEVDISGKSVLPRCIIPETVELLSAIENAGAESLVSKEDLEIVYSWPKYIKPRNREVISTTYGEFLKDFEHYKDKFGRVFFKTKYKNISCEVKEIFCLNDMIFEEISSDGDLFDGSGKMKTTGFFSEPTYMVFTNKVSHSNDLRFGFLKKDAEVFVQPFLDIVKDGEFTHIPVEYRSFVVDGKITTSRSWIPNRTVPNEVKIMTAQIVEAMPNEINKNFVVDILEYKDSHGHRYFDLCEINPLTSAGYEQGSSIFITEPTYNELFRYSKYDELSKSEEME